MNSDLTINKWRMRMYAVINLTDGVIVTSRILTRTEAIQKTDELRKDHPGILFRIYYLMIEGE